MKKLAPFLLLLAAPLLLAEVPTQVVPNAPGTSLVASRIISTRPVKVFSVIVMNAGTTPRYIQLHETNNVPLNGAAPKIPSILVGTNSTVMIDIGGSVGLDLDALTIVNSTTANTNTLGGADCMISAVLSAR